MANVQPIVEPCRDTMLAHVEHLFGGFLDGYQDGLIELAWTDSTADKDGRHRLRHAQLFGTNKLDELVDKAIEFNRIPGVNVYVGAWLRKPGTPPFGRGDDADAWALTAAYVDLDDPGAAQKAKDIYGRNKPTWITTTGREPHLRAQLWWRLEEPITDHAEGEALARGLAHALEGDSTVSNPGRVMRLAGSLAWPVKPGRVLEATRRATLKEPGLPVYAASHLQSLFPAPAMAPGQVSTPTQRGALGFGAVKDGRERYMRDTVLACLIEFMGEHGAEPTPQELFDAAWPQYQRNVDFSRPGRGPDELAEKCRSTLRRFQEGRVRGVESLDTAIELYRHKRQARAAAPVEAPTQPVAPDDDGPFPASDLSGQPPERQWLVDQWIPAGTMTAIYGDGGTGKTLLAQQLEYAAAIGGKWLGFDVPKCKALGVFCEDDKDELHRRHNAIKHALGHPVGNPFADALLWPRVGFDNLLVTFDRDSKPAMSPLFERVMEQVLQKKIGLLILDTAADLFGGNEIIRGQVNYFIKSVCGSYIRRAKEAGFTLTVIILAHPSQAGRNSGSGESGSTAWSNAVRSRLYLTKPTDGISDQRVLTRKKSNYSSAGDDEKLDLLWTDGVLVRQAEGLEGDERIAVESAEIQILRKVHSAFQDGHPMGGNKGYPNFLDVRVLKEMNGSFDRGILVAALSKIRREQSIVPDKTSSGDRRGYRLSDDVKRRLSL